jgi:hypothetical protein
MGWCSGTELFDNVVKAIPKECLSVELFKKLISAFEDMDWDCEYESKYSSNQMFKEAMKQLE